ncbi:DsrE/DsrF/DrsH-like family protein [Marivirga harenae]|uniref:DsrE/DsrF/DrsH-like family protein n=1 Tax=Marivirga harenae TaxID=2010992 RepID=UPI0026E0EED7|nr:DsrE/DsrF/DrsH-like family protein [Marivirga harenae]WKV11410.1 DsrE/DsrF/DrsH-like family protein [Marivirga harenae]|tara:strand:+ start:172845 stop:173369 length:525 start_codon:yes stop_codon:yes gene_type:complete
MEEIKEMTTEKVVAKEKKEVKKIMVICARGTLEDVYAALIMANGALAEGKEAKMFFTFFGLDAITKKKADHLHTATVGNPAFMRGMPTMIGGLPGFEALASSMMKKEMDKLDIPPVSEFFEMIEAGGGEIFACKLAADMFHLKKEDMIPEVKDIITVGQMYELAEGEGTHMVFI